MDSELSVFKPLMIFYFLQKLKDILGSNSSISITDSSTMKTKIHQDWTQLALFNDALMLPIAQIVIFGTIDGPMKNVKIIIWTVENLRIPLNRVRRVASCCTSVHLVGELARLLWIERTFSSLFFCDIFERKTISLSDITRPVQS